MALLATQVVSTTGLAPTYAAADAAGDEYVPGSAVLLHVKNASAAAVTVTVVTHATHLGHALADVPVSVPAAGERMIGPLTPPAFRNTADGRGDVTYSAVASVTVAVLSVS